MPRIWGSGGGAKVGCGGSASSTVKLGKKIAAKVKEHFHFNGWLITFLTHHQDLDGPGPYVFLEQWSINISFALLI
jgi:hypothetical protein